MKTYNQFINEVKKPTGKLKDACWSGYTAVGMKDKGGRKVPNCVPESTDMCHVCGQTPCNCTTIEEGLADDIVAAAHKAGMKSARVVTPAQKKRETETLLKKREEKAKANPQQKHYPASDFHDKYPLGGYDPVSHRSYSEEVEQVDEVAAWQRKEGKSESGGLNKKGIMSYRRENPGSKLKMAVTTKPSKLDPDSKAAKRRKSFCARMSGMKKRLTSAKTANDPDSRINKSLRKWNC